jgi:DNA primase
MGRKYARQVRHSDRLLPLLFRKPRVHHEIFEEKGRKNIYIDYLQNSRSQTLASAYSLRPLPRTLFHTIGLEELKPRMYPAQFNIKNIFSRLEKKATCSSPYLEGH